MTESANAGGVENIKLWAIATSPKEVVFHV
jgi:hypothetical protein